MAIYYFLLCFYKVPRNLWAVLLFPSLLSLSAKEPMAVFLYSCCIVKKCWRTNACITISIYVEKSALAPLAVLSTPVTWKKVTDIH